MFEGISSQCQWSKCDEASSVVVNGASVTEPTPVVVNGASVTEPTPVVVNGASVTEPTPVVVNGHAVLMAIIMHCVTIVYPYIIVVLHNANSNICIGNSRSP